MLSIVIATDPPEPTTVVQAVAKSCEAALGAGRCKATGDLEPATVVSWFALVRLPDTEGSKVSIEFHDRSERGALIETRELAFAQWDSAETRWASTGAVIAAFVAARQPGSIDPPVKDHAPYVAPQPVPPPTTPGLGWNIDLGVLAGPGLETGPWRLGAVGRGYLQPASGFLALASFRYAERPEDVDVSWWSGGAGVGTRLGGRRSLVTAELLGEVVFEYMRMSARDEDTGEEDHSGQQRFGGRLSANLALSLSDHWAIVAGAEATAMRPSVNIELGDQSVGRVPAVGFAFSAGARFGGDT
ncbi:MAG TPA: hypothetical protein VM686_23960 [Polyangiaceae bacterium]|nr:hypothetical protein [Polyangiaceae bacterium]